MKQIINDYGKPFHIEMDGNEELTKDLFHYPKYQGDGEYRHEWNVAFHSELGSITVLHRMTGYGYREYDTETGYRDQDGNFWLASGGYNAMEECDGMKIIDVIGWVKKNANTCTG